MIDLIAHSGQLPPSPFSLLLIHFRASPPLSALSLNPCLSCFALHDILSISCPISLITPKRPTFLLASNSQFSLRWFYGFGSHLTWFMLSSSGARTPSLFRTLFYHRYHQVPPPTPSLIGPHNWGGRCHYTSTVSILTSSIDCIIFLSPALTQCPVRSCCCAAPVRGVGYSLTRRGPPKFVYGGLQLLLGCLDSLPQPLPRSVAAK
jgi:hypothetical protein